jgi:hypothetical protein
VPRGRRTEHERLRMIIAPPRLIVLSYASWRREDLDRPAVNGYLDSLQIQPR